jgi:hypothetical protein
LHACEEMDDFFSLYLAVSICKAFDYGFGSKTRRPGRPKSATFHETAPSRFLYLLSIFHDHLDDDYEQDSRTQVMFSSKVDKEGLRRSGSFLSSSVYDSQEIQKSAG